MFKGRLQDKGRDAEPSYAAKVGEARQQVQQAASQPAGTPEPSDAMSTISAGMTISGKIASDGIVKIFGRVEGELKAATALICEGAHVEGNIIADELAISGCVKGTINAKRVKLQGTAVVEGDIFHLSLSIEENALFEGMSRRQQSPAGSSSNAQTKSPPAEPSELPKVASNDSIGVPDQRSYDVAS